MLCKKDPRTASQREQQHLPWQSPGGRPQVAGALSFRWYHRPAAAVEVCEPRQGREAAALSIPSRRRGLPSKNPARFAGP